MNSDLGKGLAIWLSLGAAISGCQSGSVHTVAPIDSVAIQTDSTQVSLSAAAESLSVFDTFSFGHAFLQEDPEGSTTGASNAQFANGPWILTTWEPYWHDTWLQNFLPGGSNADKVPYIYGYLVAGMAREEFGLQDCNVGTPNLCQTGAIYLRDRQAEITQRYEDVASQIAQTYGTDRPILFHLEPDFFQYAQTFNTQQQDPLTFPEAHTIMNGFITAVTQELPNAVIVLDVSPWNPDQAAWFAGMDMDPVGYVGLVGKVFPADNSVIDANRYSDIFAAANKPIIVNTAYGAGGWSAGYQTAWDQRSNLEVVADAGVIAVIQAVQSSNAAHYEQVIQQYLDHPVGGDGGDPTPTPSPTLSPTPSPTPTSTPPGSGFQVTEAIQTEWDSGYCYTFGLDNQGSTPVENWSISFDLSNAEITSSWGGTFSAGSGPITVTPVSYNQVLQPGQTSEVGLCANKLQPTDYLPSQVTYSPSDSPTPTPTPNPGSDLTAEFAVQVERSRRYCGAFSLSNESSEPIRGWQLEFYLQDAAVSSIRNGRFEQMGAQVIVTPTLRTATLPPDRTVTVSFCANKTGGSDFLPTQITIE